MFNYLHEKLKWLIAPREMEELVCRQTLMWQYRQWMVMSPSVVMTLNNMSDAANGLEALDIVELRDKIKKMEEMKNGNAKY